MIDRLLSDQLLSTCSILLAGISTLAIFSFLIKENPFYRFFEHLFIGVAAGLTPALFIRDFFWPVVLEPMFGFNSVQFPDGSVQQPYNPLLLLYIVPILVGSLYYFIHSVRYAWLAKVVIGISLGASGALAIKGFFAETIPQVVSSAKPLLVFDVAGNLSKFESFSNTLFVLILLLVFNYFFFTFGQKQSDLQPQTAGAIAGATLSRVSLLLVPLGRPLLMVCFGAFFGSTVMARLALLVERVQFLLDEWCVEILRITGIIG